MNMEKGEEEFSREKDPLAKKHARAHRIIELYWYRGKPFAEVADDLDLTIGKISGDMEELGIPRKHISEQRTDKRALRWDAERLQYVDWLTPKQQKTIQEYYLEKKSAQEIADAEGISRNWLYQRIRNTVERLEEIAEDQNASSEE